MDAMTIATIASATVSVLVPYLKSLGGELAEKATEEVGTKAGGAVWKEVNQLYKTVKTKLSSNHDSANVLKSLEKFPDDAHTQEAARSTLKEIMSLDEDFTKELLNSLKEIFREGADITFQTKIMGDVEKFIQIGNLYGKLEI